MGFEHLELTSGLSGPSTNMNMRPILTDQHSLPKILVHGVVTPDEVGNLCQTYVYLLPNRGGF